jgi:hypothetical protein
MRIGQRPMPYRFTGAICDAAREAAAAPADVEIFAITRPVTGGVQSPRQRELCLQVSLGDARQKTVPLEGGPDIPLVVLV